MVEEVMTFLRCESGGTYVDGTIGGGGHAEEILKRTSPDGLLIGLDWDSKAIQIAEERLKPFGSRARLFRENFVNLPDVIKRMEIESVDGILLDLGLSSIQLEDEQRGFSFRKEAPLDMRMDLEKPHTAAELLNLLSARELEYLLRVYGEERWARRIARAIVLEREKGPIRTTRALSQIVYRAVPRKFQSARIDPTTRTFQALRIGVNEELENLKKILDRGWQVLKKGGRMCILSFHSLEDRIVKESFRELERRGEMRVLTKKPLRPSEEEQKKNPRSRSARLRCAERR